VQSIFESVVSSILGFTAGPIVPLVLAALFLLLVVSVGTYISATAGRRADARVSSLVRDLADARAKLIEAQEVGRFGTFLWDFQEPSKSFWSEQTFVLFGLVPRAKVPAIDSIMATVHEKDRPSATESWKRIMTTPGDFVISFRTVAPSGQMRYLELRGKSMFDGAHALRALQGVVHDVTKEKDIDRAKSEFVSLASHQLKTPLTAIRWLAESLLSTKSDPLTDAQRHYVNEIHDASRRMAEMVNDLLNVSRIELGTLAMRIEEFDAVELLRAVENEQHHAAEQKHVTVNLICAENLPHLKADKSQVRMVMQNLISNAIKYTPENGTVEAELSIAGAGREVLFFRVTDTGIGIPKDQRDKVFNKMFRASNAQSQVPDGTGLGLYVIKTILEHAKGGISFDSQEGKGSTFYASIPFVWEAPKAQTV
jgi:signal transduction histidine kinase